MSEKVLKRIVSMLLALGFILSVNVAVPKAASAEDTPFIGQISMFAGNFPPNGWAFCNGQILPISQNTALFSLLGTTYGGDGITTFALPDLMERVVIGAGQGPGLSERQLGETGGATAETLLPAEMPAHSHPYGYSTDSGNTSVPGPGEYPAIASTTDRQEINIYSNSSNTSMSAAVGGSQPHENMQPYLVCNYIIALEGVYPVRP